MDRKMVFGFENCFYLLSSLYSRLRIDVWPGNFVKNNNHRALNKPRAWNKMCKLVLKKPKKLENICSLWKKFQNLINVGPLIRP